MHDHAVHRALTSQYRAALAMLRQAVTRTPAALWDDPGYDNRTWRIVCHTLHFTQLYLAASEEAFVPWPHAVTDAEILGGRWGDPTDVPVVTGVNTPDELLAWLDALSQSLPDIVAALPLDADAGFWFTFSRFELHLYNIRHVQHHTGQLVERLRAHGITGVEWAFDAA